MKVSRGDRGDNLFNCNKSLCSTVVKLWKRHRRFSQLTIGSHQGEWRLERESIIFHWFYTQRPNKFQIFFQKSTKRRLAIIDLIWDCIFLIRFHSTCGLFLTAVIFFHFTICSPFLLCLFNVVISFITTSSNHARSVNFTALLFESPFVLVKPTVSWLKRRCHFQRFTTVEQRLLLFLSCWLVLQHVTCLTVFYSVSQLLNF